MILFRGGRLCVFVLGWQLASSATLAAPINKTAPDIIAKGKYLTQAAGCGVCHTNHDEHGAPFAGGRALHTTFGTFYSPNITPDRTTGIGSWSEQDFLRALREGIRPDGSYLYPVFPYTSYTKLRDADAQAIWAYLRSLPAVKQPNKSHQLKWYAPPRFMVWFWKKLYFSPGRFRENPKHSTSWNRGAYLVNAVSHCAECHTPRNILGAEESDLRYAGANNVPEDFVAPNITPAVTTGISDWSTDDLVTYLQTGLDPDGDTAGSVMAEFIDSGLSHLRKSDLHAIAEYIHSLPPIEHSLHKKTKQPVTKKPEWD